MAGVIVEDLPLLGEEIHDPPVDAVNTEQSMNPDMACLSHPGSSSDRLLFGRWLEGRFAKNDD